MVDYQIRAGRTVCHWHFAYRPCPYCRAVVAEHRADPAHTPDVECPDCLLEKRES